MLRAAQLKDKSATIEHARLLWKDGHHRKAIQTLKGAIAANAFVSCDDGPVDTKSTSLTSSRERHQNMLAARVCRFRDNQGGKDLQNRVADVTSGPFITCEVDGQSWSNPVRCHHSEIPGSDQATHQVSRELCSVVA